jgi:hypothetical protein
MKRSDQIKDYALSVMNAYTSRDGLRTFYKINKVKIQNFELNAPAYYQMLLGAVPSGFRAEVNIMVQQLRKEVKNEVRELIKDSIPDKPHHPTEFENFGGGDQKTGEELWNIQGIGPTRE